MLKLIPPGTRKGQKAYYVRGSINGVRIERSTGKTTRRAAEAELRRIEASLSPDAKHTVAQAAILYMDQGGETRFLEPIIKAMGDVALQDVDQVMANQVAAELYPGRKPATLSRNFFVPLRAMMNCAADAGLCSPPRIKPPRIEKAPPKPAASVEYLQTLLPHCPANLGALLLFLNITGARVSEAINLMGDDVNGNKAELRHTKNGRPRLITMPPILFQAVAVLEPKPGQRVFGYSHRHSVPNTLRRACKRAGLDYMPTHQIGRHAFARNALAMGYSLQHVKAAGGWESIRMVADQYGHLEQNQSAEVMQGLGGNMGDALTIATKTKGKSA